MIRKQRIQAGLQLYVIPEGTILYHIRDTYFPNKAIFPSYMYNWYGVTPFWSSDDLKGDLVKYKYKTKFPIPNLLLWSDETTSKLFKSLYPNFVADDIDDYAQAAFATQVLGLYGMISNPESKNATIVLRGNGEKYLDLVSIETVGKPKVHPGYKSKFIPEGIGAAGNVKLTKSKHFYTPKEIEVIRGVILKRHKGLVLPEV